MALATQCPYCHTTFRVAQDQLKLRAGLVRCGNCKEIFNGVEHLLRPGEPAQSSAPPAPAAAIPVHAPIDHSPALPVTRPAAQPAPTPAPTPVPEAPPPPLDFFDLLTHPAEPPTTALTPAPPEPTPAAAPVVAAKPVDQAHTAPDAIPAAENDPLQRMTLMVRSEETEDEGVTQDDTSAGEATGEESPPLQMAVEEDPDAEDPLALAIENLHRKPSRKSKDAKKDDNAEDDFDSEEPGFVKSGRRRQRLSNGMRIVMALLSFLLLLGLLAQATYLFRNHIAARWPDTKPLLAKVCAQLGCSVGLPAQIEAVSIESSELQTLAGGKDTFALTILLRNHSQTVQTWPNIELTLNDSNEKAIARRVFAPRDYLPAPQDLSKGMSANSEAPIKLFFEVSQLKAAGYRVYLFYP